ncbi:MAG: glycine cleavage system aminomethyltransferase GcvT [Gammaproteobacteria bacterium]
MHQFTSPSDTPLAALHRELHAKTIVFAGYRMPLHYARGIIGEHLHTRAEAGFFDISHMGQFLLHGDNAAEELERLTPSAIAKQRIGQQRYTVLTNAYGGVIDDVIIARLQANSFFIVVNAACKDKDLQHLQNHLASSCRLQPLTANALLALQGPAAARIVEVHCPNAAALKFMQICESQIDGITCLVSRSGYSGEDGFEISLPAENAETLARLLLNDARLQPIGLGARDTLRMEAGLCLYGHELADDITPIEAGLSWIVDKYNVRYPGAHVIREQLQHGPPRRRVGLLPEGKAPIRDGAVLKNRSGETVGTVTSGGYGPSVGGPIAMGLVRSSAARLGETLYVTRNARELALTVSALPFVAHRYYHG